MKPPVDFGVVIAQLRVGGLSARRLAIRAHVSRGSISNYENGGEPSYTIGERIIAVWREVRGMSLEQLPRRPVHRSQNTPSGQDHGRDIVVQSRANART